VTSSTVRAREFANCREKLHGLTRRVRGEKTRIRSSVTAAFGNAARYDRTRTKAHRSQQIVDINGDVFTATPSHTETPAPTTFPALAACITAGTRCVIALVEQLVRDAGGEIMGVLTDCLFSRHNKEGAARRVSVGLLSMARAARRSVSSNRRRSGSCYGGSIASHRMVGQCSLSNTAPTLSLSIR
jgi:hypothetical protein